MSNKGNLRILIATSSLLVASLACQTLLEPEKIFSELPAESDSQVQPTQEDSPRIEPTDTPSENSARLGSENLPSLNFGEVGDSPSESDRPALSGSPQSLDTQHFRIHYSLTGDDAVSGEDQDNNGHPDFVQQVAVAMEYAWFAIIEHFGWAAPPSDEGIGGDDRYDVYLENIFEDGVAGYTEGGYSETFVGDNPNSSIVEYESSHSYMALDNDFAEFEDYEANGVTAIQFMRSTAAHEFLHAVQYGYDSYEPLDWLWEASANWIQDEVLNDYNDNIEDLYAVFKSPDSCQLAYGGEERSEDENHWYGLWIFFRYYSERYGHDAVIEIWEKAIELDAYDIWEEELEERGTSLQEFFRNFSVALLLRDFEEGLSYPSVRLEGEASVGKRFTPVDGVAQLGADYVRINADTIINITLNSDSLEGIVVGISSDSQSHLFPLEGDQSSLNASDYDYLYVIIMNQEQAIAEGACRFTDYSLDVETGGFPNEPSLSQNAPNFKAPRIEGLDDAPQESGETARSDLALIYIPEGYEFDSSYDQARADFYDQENVAFYIPGPGPVIVLEYSGPEESEFLSLYQSESPYSDLDEFFSDVAYEPLPGERQLIESFDVLIEDFSASASEPFSIATFIIDDFFYVIEGSISPKEIIEVLAAWLRG